VFAPFTTTAKEEILSPFPLCCADPPLASCMVNLEKPHQGVAGKNPALHPGITWSNSTTALGLRTLAVENRVRSRCTGKERDSESGLDEIGARYYGSSLGRFMTPDWAARPTTVPYASFGDPQTLNLYGYVRNNPLSRADLDGHGWWSDLKERFVNSWKYGEVVTNAELPAAFERERQWLVNNVAANSGQVEFLRGASTSTINGIYQKWDQAISKAASGELVYGAKDFVRGSDGNLVLASMYRGGPYTVRPGIDVKVDAVGNLTPDGLGRWRGLSVNEDPAKVSKFGEVTEVQMLPPELEFTQIGAKGHWEITNKGPMTLERYIDLTKDIVRKPLEDPIE